MYPLNKSAELASYFVIDKNSNIVKGTISMNKQEPIPAYSDSFLKEAAPAVFDIYYKLPYGKGLELVGDKFKVVTLPHLLNARRELKQYELKTKCDERFSTDNWRLAAVAALFGINILYSLLTENLTPEEVVKYKTKLGQVLQETNKLITSGVAVVSKHMEIEESDAPEEIDLDSFINELPVPSLSKVIEDVRDDLVTITRTEISETITNKTVMNKIQSGDKVTC